MPKTSTNQELAVTCPSCKAPHGMPCRSKRDDGQHGQPMPGWVHPARCRAFKAIMEANRG